MSTTKRRRSPTRTPSKEPGRASIAAHAPRAVACVPGSSRRRMSHTTPSRSTNRHAIDWRIPNMCTEWHGAIHTPSPSASAGVPSNPIRRASGRSATWQRATTTTPSSVTTRPVRLQMRSTRSRPPIRRWLHAGVSPPSPQIGHLANFAMGRRRPVGRATRQRRRVVPAPHSTSRDRQDPQFPTKARNETLRAAPFRPK